MRRRVLVVEDHPIFADALRMMLGIALPEAMIVHAGTLAEAKEALQKEEAFDLALLDLLLPDAHGLAGLIELRGRFPKLAVVVVSALCEENIAHGALVCGAAGFIPKSAGKDTFLQAIHNVLAGEIVFPADCRPPQAAHGNALGAPKLN